MLATIIKFYWNTHTYTHTRRQGLSPPGVKSQVSSVSLACRNQKCPGKEKPQISVPPA